MQEILRIFGQFPILFPLMVIIPLFGGMVGAYLGFDNLRERVETSAHQARVESELDQIKVPVEVLRRYETALQNNQQNTEVIQRILRQYDQLRLGISAHAALAGKENTNDRLAASEVILENLKSLLGETQSISNQNGDCLIIKTSPNMFRVIFATPKRIPPHIKFSGIPDGAKDNIIEKSNIGFTVIFTPQSIPVETFSFSASAEL